MSLHSFFQAHLRRTVVLNTVSSTFNGMIPLRTTGIDGQEIAYLNNLMDCSGRVEHQYPALASSIFKLLFFPCPAIPIRSVDLNTLDISLKGMIPMRYTDKEYQGRAYSNIAIVGATRAPR